jgi:dipeptidyl aminopeptidase/acylaminoacyl peptidase
MRSRVLPVVVGACLVAVLQAGCSFRDAPAEDEILFVRETARGAAVYLMSGEGGEAHRLARGTGPRWSPDGSRFAFIVEDDGEKQRECGSSIWVMNPESEASRRVANIENGVCAVAWAPDGVRLAYVGSEIGIVNTETGARDVRSLVSLGFDGVDWARDGRRMIFSSIASSQLFDTWTGAVSDVAPMRYAGDGRWSPDGERVALARINSALTKRVIVLVDKDGGNPEQVTRGASDWGPTWSPDGERIYFSRALSDAFKDGKWVHPPEIWSLDLETRSLRQLTRNSFAERWPDVRPGDRSLPPVPDPVIGDVVVPDLTGRYLLIEDEQRRLRELGLKLEAVFPLIPPRDGALASVSAQAPAAGTRALRGSVVTVTGSDLSFIYAGGKFSESDWKAHPGCGDPSATRRPMYSDLARHVLRQGMPRGQVLALLGKPSRSNTNWDDWAIGAAQLGSMPPVACFYARVEYDRRDRVRRVHQQPA